MSETVKVTVSFFAARCEGEPELLISDWPFDVPVGTTVDAFVGSQLDETM